jgi:hypothetical protein
MRVITTVSDRASESAQAQDPVHSAADLLYAAECAFHDAHHTHVDAWIKAAADKLHDAIAVHLAAVAASNCSPTKPMSL